MQSPEEVSRICQEAEERRYEEWAERSYGDDGDDGDVACVDREWQDWVRSLDHGGECATPRELVEQIAHDLIEHGGDIGPNGNRCLGVDEGLVMTDIIFDRYAERMREVVRAESGRA